MANEVKDWKAPGCSLTLKTEKLSERETFSAEINEKYGEGGGLNANYRMVEAVAIVSGVLGSGGFEYGKDFVFKNGGLDEISFDFVNKDVLSRADMMISDYIFRIQNNLKLAVAQKPSVRCLLCNGDMKLEMYETTSYFQCQKDQTHRMNLAEWSDSRDDNIDKERLVAAMKERQAILQAQIK